jgi:hypothetical protein
MSAEFHTLRSVANRGPDCIRPLGGGERFFHLYAQIYPVHFCLCVEIAGAVDSDALRSALNQVRDRHPLLRVRILVTRSSARYSMRPTGRSRLKRSLSGKMRIGVRLPRANSRNPWMWGQVRCCGSRLYAVRK